MGSAVGCIGSALGCIGSVVGCIAAFLSAISRSISGKGINELKSIRRGFCNLSTICSLSCDKGLGLLEDLLSDLDDLDLLDVSFIV
jgi:hypothetical protein